MIRSYEELTGGLGRAVSFRAERHLVRDLLLAPAADIRVDGRSYPLHDLSMNGVSFFCAPEARDWVVGAECNVAVHVHGEEVCSGLARIARAERGARQLRIGVELLTGFLDLHALQRRDEELALERDLGAGPEDVRDLVPAAYREILEQVVHFIAFNKRLLDHHEARLVAEGGRGAADALDALAQQAVAALRERWHALVLRGTDAALPFFRERTVYTAAKTYTETVLTPLLLDVPLVRRAYEKPHGYAGDYQVMLYLYRNGLEGDTVFGRVFHKLICEEPLARGVRTRKDLMKRLSREEEARAHASGQGQRPFRVMSLGCGPALEVVELLGEPFAWSGPIEWILIDQEEKALSIAHQSVVRALRARGGEGKVHCLYLSFEQLLRDPSSALLGEPQDFIYCAGLFDYLGARRAQMLVQALYERLAPGGLLAIGNAAAPNRHCWLIDFAADWTLIYRTAAEMEELADLVPRSIPREVVREPSEAYHFLLLRKP